MEGPPTWRSFSKPRDGINQGNDAEKEKKRTKDVQRKRTSKLVKDEGIQSSDAAQRLMHPGTPQRGKLGGQRESGEH